MSVRRRKDKRKRAEIHVLERAILNKGLTVQKFSILAEMAYPNVYNAAKGNSNTISKGIQKAAYKYLGLAPAVLVSENKKYRERLKKQYEAELKEREEKAKAV